MQNESQQEYWHKKLDNRDTMFQLIKEYKQGGESQISFCQNKNLHYHIFYYWVRRYKDQQSPVGNTLIPVTIPKSEQTSDSGIEIIYPNGVRMALPKNSDLSIVRTFIKMV